MLRGVARLARPSVALATARRRAPAATRLTGRTARALCSSSDDRTAYDVLGVQKGVDDATLRAVYKDLAVKWHPDRHQGEERAAAEAEFQMLSEAFQTLSNPLERRAYDADLDAAKTVVERKAAAKKFRAASWNTPVPDVAARLREAKRAEPGFPPHIIAGALSLVVANFVLVFSWLGG